MRWSIPCARCEEAVIVSDEMYGGLVDCPHCQSSFVFDAWNARQPVESELGDGDEEGFEEEEDEPQTESDRDVALPARGAMPTRGAMPASMIHPSWLSVRTGVHLMSAGLQVMLMTLVAYFVCFLISFLLSPQFAWPERPVFGLRRHPLDDFRPGGTFGLSLVMFGFFLLAYAIGIATFATGLLTCLLTPGEPQAVRFLKQSMNVWFAAAALMAIHVANAVRVSLNNSMPEGSDSMLIAFFATIATFAGMLGTILFVLYLRNIAYHFDNAPLGRNCQSYLVAVLALFCIGWVFNILFGLMISNNPFEMILPSTFGDRLVVGILVGLLCLGLFTLRVKVLQVLETVEIAIDA